MSKKKVPLLSKSRFLAGLQCPLRLWHACYNRELASKISPAQQAVFDTGHEVGRLATKLYPGGRLIEEDHLHHEEAVQSTLKAMKDPKVPAIYEGGFIEDGVRVRADILERLGGGKWNLIEVKSSTSVKDVYFPDVAVQYHVLKEAGLDIDRVILMHLNNQYVYDGKNMELKQLFCRTDMTHEAVLYQTKVPALLADFNGMLAESKEPEIKPGRHCKNPYECEFWEHCTEEMPEHWVMDLAGIGQSKLDALAAMGIWDIHDLPETFPLNEMQERIRICVKNNDEYISGGLEYELNDMVYPVHFLDFETLGLAIPRYRGTRPYQTVPFQWSDHILYEDGRTGHREYLSEEDTDPREEFCPSLIVALGTKGSIVTYTSYEEGIIKGLAVELPKYSDRLYAFLERIKDLYKIIRKHYYHPEFHGSFSLKSVVPALLPQMSYDSLAVQEGQQAGLEYLRMIDPLTSPGEKEKIKKTLLDYCGHDTLVMVKVREELLKRLP